ncbi:MAG: hypothetical protein M1815_000166 [Lichina confinis]|nr:MAG: hypothetical protein M1815_000166 [Lichina confinis]
MSNSPAAPKRGFPRPIETTTESFRAAAVVTGEAQKSKPDDHALTPQVSCIPCGVRSLYRFKPEPIETSARSSKARAEAAGAEHSNYKAWHQPWKETNETPPRALRRLFAPELIKTSQCSRASLVSLEKAPAPVNDGPLSRSQPEFLHSAQRRGESGLAFQSASPDLDGNSTSTCRTEHGILRSASPGRADAIRRHSFQVPTLDPIETSESDDSRCPSLSTSPSAPSEDNSMLAKRASKMRESCDHSYSGCLLGLTAQAAEKQLREQAMAAYANSEFHEPVSHFAIDRESDPSDDDDEGAEEEFLALSHEVMMVAPPAKPTASKRDSMTGMAWELQETRRHHERLRLQRRPSATKGIQGQVRERRRSRDSFGSALVAARQGLRQLDGATRAGSLTGDSPPQEVGYRAMSKAASPPLLGRDLTFRRCPSPKSTMLQVDFRRGSRLSDPRERPNEFGNGLWRGLCVSDGSAPPASEPSRLFGIKTPDHSVDDVPREKRITISVGGDDDAALHATSTHLKTAAADRRRDGVEDDAASQVTDEFVSQVYNYLSLGYSSVARKFDDELSRISRVPVDLLDRDDGSAKAKGFVGLAQGVGITLQAAVGGNCPRWLALRIYIEEWIRQHPDLDTSPLGPDAWGFTARRGSWAI